MTATAFIAGGPLHPVDDNRVIILREELDQILDHIQSYDNYVVLESSRQTGKTTLLYQIQHRLHNQGYGVVYLDFSLMNNQSMPEFYRSIFKEIKDQLIDLINLAEYNSLEMTNVINFSTFSEFLKSLSCQTPTINKLILMFDEIGHIPESIFSSLFAGLRGFFSEGRGLSRERLLCKKVIVVCAGTLDTKKLIKGINSPFKNICVTFTLNDFSQKQVFNLAQNLQGFSSKMIEIVGQFIYSWTAGHPYLTQRLLQLIDQKTECRNASPAQIEEIIEAFVNNEFIDNDDVNLQHILEYLNKLEEETNSCLSAVKKVLNVKPQQPIITVEHQDDLQLIGIVKRLPDRSLVIRNRIYAEKLKNDPILPQPMNQQQVYISYNWQEDSNEIADRIVQAFEAKGIEIIRDKTHTTYKDSIRNFMQQIGQGKCVVAVISDSYLKSENCMFELVEIAKHDEFRDRIFPLVLPDAKIHEIIDRINYIEHWQSKKRKLQLKYKKIDLPNTDSILETLNLYDEIERNIDNLINILKDMNTLTPDLHRESEFEAMIQAVEAKLAREDQNK